MSQLTKAKHSFRYHPYLYDFLNIATFLRSNAKLPQSFSTLVSGLYSPVSLLFPRNRRVAIKICLKPFNDFPISLKIKLNPLTWPNRPCETSPCLPTTWTLSLVSHFSPRPPRPYFSSLSMRSTYLPWSLCLHKFFCMECSHPRLFPLFL